MKPRIQRLVLGPQLQRYFRQFVSPHPYLKSEFFWSVHTPLPVFKKAYPQTGVAIVNLTIPVGATVFCPSFAFAQGYGDWPRSRKMRASEALVHSIARLDGAEVPCAYSMHDSTFKYVPGKIVVPRTMFSVDPESCASGIHFFLNLKDAYKYEN